MKSRSRKNSYHFETKAQKQWKILNPRLLATWKVQGNRHHRLRETLKMTEENEFLENPNHFNTKIHKNWGRVQYFVKIKNTCVEP